jgi:hypothetical protein
MGADNASKTQLDEQNALARSIPRAEDVGRRHLDDVNDVSTSVPLSLRHAPQPPSLAIAMIYKE